MLHIDIIGPGANEGSWIIVHFFRLGLHTAERDEGFGDLILSLDVKVVRAGSYCGVRFDIGHYFLSSKDKCH